MNAYIRRIFVVSGILCLIAAFGIVGYNIADSKRAESESLSVLDSLIPAIEEKKRYDVNANMTNNNTPEPSDKEGSISPEDTSAPVTPSYVADYITHPDMEMPSIEIGGQRYVGYLEIPDINLKLPVAGGSFDMNVLRYSPAVYKGSVYKNDMVIAAHNYTAHFAPLYYVKEGTNVIFTDADGHVFRYRVGWTENLYPSEHDKMISGDSWDLALFTCTLTGEQRFTVRCIADKK